LGYIRGVNKPENIKRLPGFRDFAPQELAVRARTFDAWRAAAQSFGFQEYDGPPLEPVDLYTRKSGDEIVGQLYDFVDKGERHVALRPEMTPSLARILAQKSRALPKPIRWFSMPQLFRYERQQRGRLREHFQWNVDIVGEAGIGADAEVLAVALEGLRLLGLTERDVEARVSDRPLLRAILMALGIPEATHDAVFQVIDKLERAGPEWARERLSGAGIGPAGADELLGLISDAGPEDLAQRFRANDAVIERLDITRDYLERLRSLGFAAWVSFDLTIVRGLAYYTGTVFEIFDRARDLRALCGGGRYDRLLELVGGDPLPAVGFGMGDVVLGELLEERGLVPEWTPAVDAFIVLPDADLRSRGLEVAAALRRGGNSVLYAFSEDGVRRQFKTASASGARFAVVVGPDEVARGQILIRDMGTGDEYNHDLTNILNGTARLGSA